MSVACGHPPRIRPHEWAKHAICVSSKATSANVDLPKEARVTNPGD